MNYLSKKKILVTHINAETGTNSDSVADVQEDHDVVEVLRQEESHSVTETSDHSDLEDEKYQMNLKAKAKMNNLMMKTKN